MPSIIAAMMLGLAFCLLTGSILVEVEGYPTLFATIAGVGRGGAIFVVSLIIIRCAIVLRNRRPDENKISVNYSTLLALVIASSLAISINVKEFSSDGNWVVGWPYQVFWHISPTPIIISNLLANLLVGIALVIAPVTLLDYISRHRSCKSVVPLQPMKSSAPISSNEPSVPSQPVATQPVEPAVPVPSQPVEPDPEASNGKDS